MKPGGNPFLLTLFDLNITVLVQGNMFWPELILHASSFHISVYKSASCQSVIRSLVHECIPNPIIMLVKTPHSVSRWGRKSVFSPMEYPYKMRGWNQVGVTDPALELIGIWLRVSSSSTAPEPFCSKLYGRAESFHSCLLAELALISMRSCGISTQLFLLNQVWDCLLCFPRDRLSVGCCGTANPHPAQAQRLLQPDFLCHGYRVHSIRGERLFIQDNQSIAVGIS